METNVDWQTLDVGLTTAVGISSQLYLLDLTTLMMFLQLTQVISWCKKMIRKVNLGAGIGTFSAPIYMVDNTVSGGTTSLGTNVAYKISRNIRAFNNI